MSDIPVTNNGKDIKWVGQFMIHPGQTRLIPAHEIPGYVHPKNEEETSDEKGETGLLLWLDHPAKEVKELIQQRNESGGPIVSDEELNQLIAAEKEGKNRKGLMSAFDAEILQRAQETAEGEPYVNADGDSEEGLSDSDEVEIEPTEENE